ncbi:MAG: M3 family oligoendopeptidase [Oscillospiraceae bacterium]|nr:M3 family oligoendopeptidase [Oscillospiraceae bacterium]
MKFWDIPYERADLEAFRREMEALICRFENAESAEAAAEAYAAMDTLEANALRTPRTIAQIRRDINTADEFYDAENAFYNREIPALQPLLKRRTKALLESPFRKELEEKLGSVIFVNAEMSMKTFSPELVQDLQRENELTAQYSKLLASAQIEFEGKTYAISQMQPFKLDPDDKRRLAAWTAEGNWYNEHGEELDRIYDELVKLRDGMGRKLGYDGFTELGYYRMKRNCYTMDDVENFRIAVQDYVVPVAKKIYLRQAQRQGREFPLNFADKDLSFRSGNPRPVGTPEEVVATGTKFYSELSEETKAYWAHMTGHEMMDVESKPGKRGGAYCTGIPAYRSPFILASLNGTAHDVEVITHEAGHGFAVFLNRDRTPIETIWPSLEACEVHSMSMEFFAEPWAEDFFGADAKKFLYTHLTGALSFIPYGTMVDHFQHIMYEYPDFDPEERHQVWRELLGLYMPWAKPGDVPFYGDGKGWQRQQHIYMSPFYYIDYCLAQTVSLEFWRLIREDPKVAFQTYLRYTEQGGSKVFTDLLKTAGLSSPFEEETLKKICAEAMAFIDSYDLSGLE